MEYLGHFCKVKCIISGGNLQQSSGAIQFVMGSFWFVVIVIVATYSSNLIAILSVDKVLLPFTTLEEFANQDEYLPIVPSSTSLHDLIRVRVIILYHNQLMLFRCMFSTKPIKLPA